MSLPTTTKNVKLIVNPLTNRLIKVGSRVYRELVRAGKINLDDIYKKREDNLKIEPEDEKRDDDKIVDQDDDKIVNQDENQDDSDSDSDKDEFKPKDLAKAGETVLTKYKEELEEFAKTCDQETLEQEIKRRIIEELKK